MPVNYSEQKRKEYGYVPSDNTLDRQLRGDKVTVKNKSRKLTVKGDAILCNGVPIRELGVNDFSPMSRLVTGGGMVNYYSQMERMRDFGIRYVRAFLGFPAYLKGAIYTNTYFRTTPEKEEEYYALLKSYLDAADKCDIGVVLCFFPDPWVIPDAIGERLNVAFGMDGNLLTNSASMQLMAHIIEQVVTRFKDHPAIAGWEAQNEWDLKADYQTLPEVRTDLGTLSSYTKEEDTLTLSTMKTLTQWVCQKIKEYDTSDILVSSGNNGPIRQSSYEYAFGDTSMPSGDIGSTYIAACISDLNLAPVNAISIHRYSTLMGARSLFDSYDLLVSIRKKAKELHRTTGRDVSFIIGEFGAAWWAPAFDDAYEGFNNNTDVEQYEKGLSSIYDSGVQLAFVWAWLEKNVAYSDKNGDWNFHPDYTYANYSEKAEIVKRYIQKFRSEDGYIDPDELPMRGPYTLQQNGMANLASDGYQSIMQASLPDPSSIIHDDGYGMTFDAWVYVDYDGQGANYPYTRTLLGVGDIDGGSLSGGCMIEISGTQGTYDYNRIAPVMSFVDTSTGSTYNYNTARTSCPGPGNILKGWNHLYLQVATRPGDPNFGINFGWNGHKIFIDGVSITNRFGSVTGSTLLFKAPTTGKISVFGNLATTQTTYPFTYYKARHGYSGVANLRFYRRSLSDAELVYAYTNGIGARDYSLRSTSKDNTTTAEKLVFTFDNTYTSTDGSTTFIPFQYNGQPLCQAAGFSPVDQRVYWETESGI